MYDYLHNFVNVSLSVFFGIFIIFLLIEEVFSAKGKKHF